MNCFMACSGVMELGFGLLSVDLLEAALLCRQWWAGSEAEVWRSVGGSPCRAELRGARPLGWEVRTGRLLVFSSNSWVTWTCDCEESWTASDMVALEPP